MRIGILTFHRAINYGAVMQAYSLQTRLKKDFPDDEIEIIDYNSRTREWFKIKCPIVFAYRRSIKESIQKIKQTRAFGPALKKLSLSKSLLCAKYDDVNSYINDHYDVVVVGSDAVFNWKDIGIPNPYFLEGADVDYKLSYAASSHLQDYRNISSQQKAYLEKALSSFQYIGVRDDNSSTFVEYVTNKKDLTYHNCDPTIFLDMHFDEMNLQKKLKKHGFDHSKKTVFVMLMKAKYGEYVRKHFGDDCQIVALMDGNKYADLYLYDLNPFEWAKVFSHGSFLVTDYFHGTILALKNSIPVLSIDSSGYGADGDYESKASDLLKKRLNLPEMYISSKELESGNGYEIFSERIRLVNDTFDRAKLEKSIRMEAENYNSFYHTLTSIHSEKVGESKQ